MRSFLLGLIAATLAMPAAAGNVANCEVLLLEIIKDKDMGGQAQVASYRPATDYIASVYNGEAKHITQIDGHPIRALMCRRNDVLPTETDYKLMATGIPFILSQDFDSPDTDSLTTYWKEGKFEYVYKGYPMSDEAKTKLESRLTAFTKRGLNANSNKTFK